MADAKTISFSDLLASVATEPGKLEQAFQTFHNYSIGNQLMALFQCLERAAQRIFKAADTILRAGRVVVDELQEAA